MAINTFIVIQSFMVDKLNLQGNELLAYALVYGFSQDGESEFKGSLTYIADRLNITRKTAANVVKRLVGSGLIEKRQESKDGVTVNFYYAKITREKITPPQCKNYTTPSVKITPPVNNNINNNNINNNTQDYSNTLESVVCNNTHARAHEPPTPKLEDVLAYAKQQNEFAGVGGYKITKYVATRFYDYYTATGWRNKNNMPIVDWRAQLRLWASDVRHQEKPEKLDKPVKLW